MQSLPSSSTFLSNVKKRKPSKSASRLFRSAHRFSNFGPAFFLTLNLFDAMYLSGFNASSDSAVFPVKLSWNKSPLIISLLFRHRLCKADCWNDVTLKICRHKIANKTTITLDLKVILIKVRQWFGKCYEELIECEKKSPVRCQHKSRRVQRSSVNVCCHRSYDEEEDQRSTSGLQEQRSLYPLVCSMLHARNNVCVFRVSTVTTADCWYPTVYPV